MILATIVLVIVGAIIFVALTFIDRKVLLILAIAAVAYLVIRTAVAAGIRDAQGR